MILVVVSLLLAGAVTVLVRKRVPHSRHPLIFLADRRAVIVGAAVGAAVTALNALHVTATPLNITSAVAFAIIWFLIAATITHHLRRIRAGGERH
jgi:amino acid transporter